jgi:tetratricopeptide (TPR) repeat protein
VLNRDEVILLEPIAYAQLAASDLSAATKSFEKLLVFDRLNKSALAGLGVTNYQLGNLERSREQLKQATELDPIDTFSQKYLGAVSYELRQLSTARTHLDVAVRLDVFDPFSRRTRGRVLLELQEFESALIDFDVALQVNSIDIEALTGRGLAHHAMGRNLNLALADFLKAVELEEDPVTESAYLWNNLGQVQMELKQLQQARTSLEIALKLDDSFAESRSHRAYLLAANSTNRVSDLETARADVEAVFANKDYDRSYWDYRALAAVNYAMKDRQRAIRFQQMALEHVTKSGPPRFVEEAKELLNQYSR